MRAAAVLFEGLSFRVKCGVCGNGDLRKLENEGIVSDCTDVAVKLHPMA